MTVTAEDIRGIVEASIEPSEPQTSILRFLQERNGKKLTERMMPKMRETVKDESLQIRKVARMTSIEWGNYSRTGGNEGGSLLVSYGEPIIDADVIPALGCNRSLFDAAEARNEERRKVLNDFYDNGCLARGDELPEPIRECAEALNAIKAAKDTLERLFAYQGPLSADEYRIKRFAKEKGIDL